MNTPTNTDTRKPLRTADLAAAGAPPIERVGLRRYRSFFERLLSL